jgi:GT2 family glycosyltransferase
VILLDNASADGTADYVAQQYPWVRLIRSDTNLGFTRGNNVAARLAQGDYILLLNPDTILKTDVEPAVRILRADPHVGVVGARTYLGNGEEGHAGGHFPTVLRLWKFTWLWANPTKHPYGEPALRAYKVDWVEGSFLLTRSNNWRAIGGLDEGIFMYGEEVIFCRSTRDNGLVTVHCPDVEYVHFAGFNLSRLGYQYAGFCKYHQKFSYWPERSLATFVLRVGLLLRIVVFGVIYKVTGRQRIGEKYRRVIQINKEWPKNNFTAPRFE